MIFNSHEDIGSLEYNENGKNKHTDAQRNGLFIEVLSNGRKVFRYPYTSPVTGKRKTYTFGDFNGKNYRLGMARSDLGDIKRDIKNGLCPNTEKSKAKVQPDSRKNKTLKEVIDLFLEDKRDLKTHYAYVFNLTKKIPAKYSKLPIRDIEKDHIRDIAEAQRSEQKTARRKLQKIIKSLFSWALEKDYIEYNVTKDVKYIDKEGKRERVLATRELKKIWDEADNYGYPFGDAFKILMLTGVRLGECAKMKRININFDEQRWTIPAEDTKAGRAIDIYLAPTAMEILKRIDDNHLNQGSKYMFTAKNGDYIKGFTYAKKKIADKVNLSEQWQIHDFRRSATTHCSTHRFFDSIEAKKAFLNHSGLNTGATRNYDYNDFYNQTKQARLDYHDWLFYRWGHYDHLRPKPRHDELEGFDQKFKHKLNHIKSLPEEPHIREIREFLAPKPKYKGIPDAENFDVSSGPSLREQWDNLSLRDQLRFLKENPNMLDDLDSQN